MKTHTTMEFRDIKVGELFVYDDEGTVYMRLNDSDKNNAIALTEYGDYIVEGTMEERVCSIRDDEDVNDDEYGDPQDTIREAREACRKHLDEIEMEATLLRRLFGSTGIVMAAPTCEGVGSGGSGQLG